MHAPAAHNHSNYCSLLFATLRSKNQKERICQTAPAAGVKSYHGGSTPRPLVDLFDRCALICRVSPFQSKINGNSNSQGIWKDKHSSNHERGAGDGVTASRKSMGRNKHPGVQRYNLSTDRRPTMKRRGRRRGAAFRPMVMYMNTKVDKRSCQRTLPDSEFYGSHTMCKDCTRQTPQYKAKLKRQKDAYDARMVPGKLHGNKRQAVVAHTTPAPPVKPRMRKWSPW